MPEDLLTRFSSTDDAPGVGRRHQRRRNRRVLAGALVLLLLPVLGVCGYFAYLNHVVSSNIKHQNLLPDTGSNPGSNGADSPAAVTGKGQNYLLLGSDARAGLGGGRSDVILLVHVPQDHAKVQIIHFPRDLYVPIPGHGKDKINAAYAFGGPQLLTRTMQDMLGVHVDHVALIGFDGLKAMTDAVGGVDVNVEEASNENGYAFHKGMMHLDGEHALAFVRERHQLSEGDISRGRRQQAFLKALMLKGVSKDTLTNPVQLARFVDAGTRYTAVDQSFTVSEMRREAFSLKDLRSNDITFVTAPFTGFGTSPAGASIDIVDDAGMLDLGQHLADDTMGSYKP